MPSDGSIDVIVDRLVRGSDLPERRLDSIETAFTKGFGRCRLLTEAETSTFYQGWRCGHCGIDYLEPDPRLFRYNSPLGACPTCEGFGRVIDLDLDRIVPDTSKTLRGGAIVPGRRQPTAASSPTCSMWPLPWGFPSTFRSGD